MEGLLHRACVPLPRPLSFPLPPSPHSQVMRVQQLGRRWALSKGALILMRMLTREVRHALRLRRGRARARVCDVSAMI